MFCSKRSSGHPVMLKDKALCKRSQALVSCHTPPPFCVQPALCVTQISSCFQAFLTAGRILDFPRLDHSAFHNWSSLIFRRETGLSELPLVLYSSSPPSTEFREFPSCTFIKRNFCLVPVKTYSPLPLLLAINGSYSITNYIMSIYFPLYDKYCGHTLYHSGLQYFESLHPTPRTPLSLLTAPFAPEVDHRCLESPGVMPSFRNLRAHPCHYFLLSSDIMVMMFGIWIYSSKVWCDNSDTLIT